ncbi:MAG: hypothetical protein OFPII_30750 [Osedax symbiont Rs1]|nr:MAG: hypothetical protein OFPII_30750 [Osedax symbiont Rs1]
MWLIKDNKKYKEYKIALGDSPKGHKGQRGDEKTPEGNYITESVISLHHIAQALDYTAVRKILAEPTGAAKIFQFHRRTNILHSVFTLKSRIQVYIKL